MTRIDLHTHTRFFHGFNSRSTWYDPLGVRLLVANARRNNLDAIAVTNHDYFRQFDIDTGNLQIIPGIEISSTLGHILVVGPDPPAAVKPRKLTPAEVVDIAHENGCAAIIAHPYRDSTVVGTDAEFDAIEVNGKRSSTADRLEALADERDLPLVGGSDAHYPFEVGRTFTVIESDPLTPEGIVEAVQHGRVTYHIDERHPSQALRHGYRVIHRLKGHTTAETEQSNVQPSVPTGNNPAE